MRIQCVIRFLGIWEVCRTQWDIYPQDWTDKQWTKYYRGWIQPWCRYLCTYQLRKE